MARTDSTDDFTGSLLTALAVLFPVLITVFLLSWLYHQMDVSVGERTNALCREVLVRNRSLFVAVFPGVSGGELEDAAARRAYAEQHFPRFVGVLLGLVAAAVLVYLIGRSLRAYIGARAMRAVDRFFERLPLIKAIYPHARHLGDLLFGQSERRRFITAGILVGEQARSGTPALAGVYGESGEGQTRGDSTGSGDAC